MPLVHLSWTRRKHRRKKLNQLTSWFFISPVPDHKSCSLSKTSTIPTLEWTFTNMNPRLEKKMLNVFVLFEELQLR